MSCQWHQIGDEYYRDWAIEETMAKKRREVDAEYAARHANGLSTVT
jgi:hypothetical protein